MTRQMRLQKLMIAALAKHLPPSASTLRLLDVNGEVGQILQGLRGDLDIVAVPGDVQQWPQTLPDAVDAIVAYGYVLNDPFMERALTLLRPGGRLIIVDPIGEVTSQIGERLEAAGFVRILVETAVECPLLTGVLMRGERAHSVANTLERIQQVAMNDADTLDLTTYRGRYVHLLIQQTPNVPAWAQQPEDPIRWQAIAIEQSEKKVFLAFSSLPKAVGFMQPAVLAGRIVDINKVGKFRKEIVPQWHLPVLLNPDVNILNDNSVILVDVDPQLAEAPNE